MSSQVDSNEITFYIFLAVEQGYKARLNLDKTKQMPFWQLSLKTKINQMSVLRSNMTVNKPRHVIGCVRVFSMVLNVTGRSDMECY
jgi:hypothetical protein